MALIDHQAAVDGKARAPSDIVTPADRDAAIQAAVLRYSQDRPRELVVDVVSDGSQSLPLPAGWSPGESELLGVETPIGEMPPVLLDAGAFLVMTTPGGDQIGVLEALALGQVARLRFTAPHTVTAALDTVPARHREALACWAAAILCDQVAASHAENREPTIQADRVDYTSPTKEWTRRAEAFRKLYFQLLGIDTGPGGPGSGAIKPKPAGAVVNLDVPDSRLKARLGGRRWR